MIDVYWRRERIGLITPLLCFYFSLSAPVHPFQLEANQARLLNLPFSLIPFRLHPIRFLMTEEEAKEVNRFDFVR
jgi:hypothetical protein